MASPVCDVQTATGPDDWAALFDFTGHLERFIQFLEGCDNTTNMARYRKCIMAALENDDCHYYQMARAITYEPTGIKQEGRILKGTELCGINGD